MTIDKEIEAKILRYHFVEQWRVGTIATQLGIHHGVVDRVLSQAGLPKVERSPRPSIIDPYLPFIIETLNEFPTLTAATFIRDGQSSAVIPVAPVSFANASASYDHANSPKPICV